MEQSLQPCPVCKTTEHPKSTNKGHLCKKCANVRSLEWARKNKQRHTSNQMQYRYGISKEMYDEKIKQQQNKCAICHQEETAVDNKGTVKNLAIDHNHSTGKVRDLLCKACNVSLGLLKEDKEILKSMLNYIEKHNDT